jgi:hypothetical protein
VLYFKLKMFNLFRPVIYMTCLKCYDIEEEYF